MRPGLLSLLLVLLAGCAQLPLLRVPPADVATPRVAQQRLQLLRGDAPRTLELAVDLDARRLALVASAFGARLFALQYDGRRVVREAGLAPARATPPDRIVNDLLLIYAPEMAVRAALPQGWTLETGERLRRVRRGGVLVAEVRYHGDDAWNGRSELTQHRAAYRLVIDSAVSP